MRRLGTFIALLVLSLSRFGVTAPAPARATTWAEPRQLRDALTPSPRFAVAEPREAAPRIPPRATSPWLPFHGAEPVGIADPIARRATLPWLVERSPLGAITRVTYDATAPPRVS